MTERPPLRVLAWPARRKRRDNPYTYLLQQATARHGIQTSEFGPLPLLRSRWDVIHVHWPDMVLLHGGALRQAITGAALLVILRVHRRLGATLVWTVHNIAPHERRAPRVVRWFMHSFASLSDAIISPSNAGLSLAVEAYPQLAEKPSAVIPIGSYEVEYPAPPSKSEARRRLGVAEDAFLFVSLGMIRPYKNLPRLASQFSALLDPDARLIIAGPPKDADEVQRLADIAAADPRIRVIPERIDDKRVPEFLSAADRFVAPFTSIVNSGSLLLALAFRRPALVPNAGAMPEVADLVGPGWVETFEGQLTSDHLRNAMAAPTPTTPPDLRHFAWDGIGAATASFFRNVSTRQPTDQLPAHDNEAVG